jgi:hypothetical protein
MVGIARDCQLDVFPRFKRIVVTESACTAAVANSKPKANSYVKLLGISIGKMFSLEL